MASSSCCPPSSPFVVKFPLPSTSTCFENCLQLIPFSANRDLLSCWMPTTVWEELFSLFTLQFAEQQIVASFSICHKLSCCHDWWWKHFDIFTWPACKQNQPSAFFYPLNHLLWFLKASFVGQRAAHPSCKRRRRMTKKQSHQTPHTINDRIIESPINKFFHCFLSVSHEMLMAESKMMKILACCCRREMSVYLEVRGTENFNAKICHRSCCCCWSLQWCHCFFQLEWYQFQAYSWLQCCCCRPIRSLALIMSAPFLSTLIITVIIDPTDRPAEEKKDMAGFPFLETILEEEGEVIYVMLQSFL